MLGIQTAAQILRIQKHPHNEEDVDDGVAKAVAPAANVAKVRAAESFMVY